MKHKLWQKGHNHLHAGVSLPSRLHIPDPIHTLPTSLLGFCLPGLPPPPTSDFQMSSEPSCLGILLPDSFYKIFLGLGELLTSFLAASLPHALPTLLPAPFPRCYIISKVMFYKHILKFPSFTLHSKIPSRLTTY